MKSISIASGFVSFLLSQSVWAASAYKISPTTEAATTKSRTALKLFIEDVAAKQGVCPYYVKSQQYLEGIKLLNIEIYQETCLNDAFGRSNGELAWVVPNALLKTGSEIKVLVNQNPSGILVYDESTKKFQLK